LIVPSPPFVKRSLEGFEPYTPGQQPPDGEGWIKLNTNEAPWPPSARVLAAIREAVDESLRLYPDPLASAARREIADHHGLDPGQVALGNGGDELIELCFRAFAGSGDRVAFPHPTYPLLEPLSAVHECRMVRHPLGERWELPPEFAADGAPLKFLVNPNSPTGSWLDGAVVRDVVRRSTGVVVVDEAYVDFAPEDRLDLVREGCANVLLLRTFSKSYALAGMRIGYALGSPALIAALDLVKDSYNLDRLAIAAAVAAIRDREHHDRLVRFVVEERGWLSEALRRRGFEVVDSATNFVLARPAPGVDAAELCARLRDRRILVRHYAQEPVAGWIRVTVGPREQHERLMDAIEEATSAGGSAPRRGAAHTPSRDEAWTLVQESTRSETLRRHMLSVEAAMRAYARRFDEDEERWGVLGLIHDWDYESGPTPEQHPARGLAMLRERGWPEDMLEDIASHAEYLHVPRDRPARKALYAVDELCGFLIACALVKPDRSLSAVDVRTVRKKMKDKAFARGVHREQLTGSAEDLGVPFDEHVVFVRDALVPIAEQLGLRP
jgi:histidinol-phosphate aminotransferase